jgi:hypothetical protein
VSDKISRDALVALVGLPEIWWLLVCHWLRQCIGRDTGRAQSQWHTKNQNWLSTSLSDSARFGGLLLLVAPPEPRNLHRDDQHAQNRE